MKYIRTKDGIYEINWFDTDNFGDEKGDIHSNCEIINEADTIEELCDEFIVVSDNCERPIISALPFNELQLYAKGRTKYAICYGAIWCEWGLKYVARMNSDGVLELL